MPLVRRVPAYPGVSRQPALPASSCPVLPRRAGGPPLRLPTHTPMAAGACHGRGPRV